MSSNYHFAFRFQSSSIRTLYQHYIGQNVCMSMTHWNRKEVLWECTSISFVEKHNYIIQVNREKKLCLDLNRDIFYRIIVLENNFIVVASTVVFHTLYCRKQFSVYKFFVYCPPCEKCTFIEGSCWISFVKIVLKFNFTSIWKQEKLIL